MTFEIIKNIIIDNFDEEEIITLETHLVSDLGIDALDLMELICEIEEEFDLEIADEDAKRLKTVADIVNYVEARKA